MFFFGGQYIGKGLRIFRGEQGTTPSVRVHKSRRWSNMYSSDMPVIAVGRSLHVYTNNVYLSIQHTYEHSNIGNIYIYLCICMPKTDVNVCILPCSSICIRNMMGDGLESISYPAPPQKPLELLGPWPCQDGSTVPSQMETLERVRGFTAAQQFISG